MKLKIKYRVYDNAFPPKKTKLEIPGWAGENNNENKPQPFHCLPWIEGSLYGLELIYPFQSECRVKNVDGNILFLGDFSNVPWLKDGQPPFSNFAPEHYGFTSSLDMLPPEEYCVRIEPHPRFFTDTTGTVPIAVPGHIKRFWSRIFFVVFKSPRIGEEHIFRYGEAYAQVLIVPEKIEYDIEKMSVDLEKSRKERECKIGDFRKSLAKHTWKDYKGNEFDDKYKVLNRTYDKEGDVGIDILIDTIQKKRKVKETKIKKRFFKK